MSLWPGFWRSLAAILIGNAIYFFLFVPYLPEKARHQPFGMDVGLLVDFWVCLVVYGVIELVRQRKRRNKSPR